MADKKKISNDDLKKLEVMSALGMSLSHTAIILGMSKQTLERRIKKNAKVRDAIDRGKANASQRVRAALLRAATEKSERVEEFVQSIHDPKDPTYRRRVLQTNKKTVTVPPSVDAMKFWCETQEGFRKTQRLEIAKAAAIDAEFEHLSDEQIEERIRRMEAVNK